jgi:competence protein ComEC
MGALSFYSSALGFLGGVFIGSIILVPLSALVFGTLLGFGFWCAARIAKRRIYACVCLALMACVFGAVRILITPTTIPSPFVPLLNQKVSLEGTIIVPPDMRESNDKLTVQVVRDGAHTNILASAATYPAFHVGDRVRISGTLTKPKPFDGDGGRIFRYDQFLSKDGIFSIISIAHVEIVGQDPSLWLGFLRVLENIKDAFVRAVGEAIPEPESALAVGIVAGGKQGLGARLLDAFTVAGMLQIVVLSGYNVMIVAEGILVVLRGLSKRMALTIAAVAITLFVLAAGAGSSAVRAGIMALIALTARGTHRTYDVLRALFAALILMILWNPLLLVFDPGLQLSFMATLGLILGSNLIEVRLGWIGSSMVREMLATTLAAQAAVLPLLLYQSGNLSLVAIPANIAAMPVLPAAMALSSIAAGVAFVFGSVSASIPLIVGIPAYVLLWYVISIAEWSARVPFANVILPAFSAWLLIPSYAALGWVVWKAKRVPVGAKLLPAPTEFTK